jgi:signal transduction histidine kinase
MSTRGDFPQQVTAGAAAVILSVVLTGFMAVVGVRQATLDTHRLTGVYAESAIDATQLESDLERRSSFAREYLLVGDERARHRTEEETVVFERNLPELRARAHASVGRALLDRVDASELRYAKILEDAVARRASNDPGVGLAFERDVVPAKEELASLLSAYAALKEQQFLDAEATSVTNNARTIEVVEAVAALALTAAVALTILLGRGIRELTRRRALIEESLARVEQSNRDLDAFAGRVAHDLRGALAPIVLAPKILAAENVSPERTRTVARALDRAVERAVGLLDALLAFSRAGAQADARAVASARPAIAEVTEVLESSLAQADASLMAEIDDAEVRCPPGLLHIVLLNIVGNAVKFVKDRPLREIRIRGRVARGGYELSVDDTGPGIPVEARAKIFEPFYRVPGTTVSGTGIGLATVRRVVDAYGGRIAVDSTVGTGSSIKLWLPLAVESSGLDPTSAGVGLQ